jgi:predicted metalloendopeptidase
MPRHRRTKKVRNTKSICLSADDFWNHVNGAWFDATRIPPTETRITQAYFIRQTINRELDTIIHAAKEGAIADILSSWRAAEGHVIPPGLTPLLMGPLSATKPAEYSRILGWMNRVGMNAPLSVSIQGDPRDHSRCRVVLEEGTPNIGIPEYWDWPDYTEHRKAYGVYIRALAAATGIPALLRGYGAERDFAKVFPSMSTQQKPVDTLTWTELQQSYTTIDWTALLGAYGLSADEMAALRYNITAHPFLHHLQGRMRSWEIRRWQGWLALLVVQWIAGISPPGPLRAAWFAYTRRHLQGMEADDSPEELRCAVVRTLLPKTLGQAWVRRYCRPALRDEIRQMTQNIRYAAAATLQGTSWMAPRTRAAAVAKLRAMDIQVCWPDASGWGIRDLECDLDPTDFLGNLLTLSSAAADRRIQILRAGNCRKPEDDGWSRPVYEVNAFYYPEENRFLLPAAILRPPFYDSRKSLAWNYGGIGATIGHELCHAFDADGRKNDERGDQRDWWTARDDREYRRRAAAVVRLYESVPYRGMDVDGSLTLVENIADLGGLEFALAGLRRALGRAATKEELREFMTSYAISWRSKDRLRRAAELLATDPHAPPRLRVNHAVRQLDEWYDAFDIGPDCPGYIAPERRIHFFT